MSAEADVVSPREDDTRANGQQDISVKTHETDIQPTTYEPSKEESLSASLTLLAAGFGLISDGYQTNLMTMANVIFEALYPVEYTSAVSTRVSNALLIGDIVGQLLVGVVCDRMGRKVALMGTTLLVILGATLATAAHGLNGSIPGLFWFLTVARGITGVGVGGEYPAASISTSESANEKSVQARGPSTLRARSFLFVLTLLTVTIVMTSLVLALGFLLCLVVFLIVLCVVGEQHLQTVWRVCFGTGIVLPLSVLVLRLRMLSSVLYRKSAIKRRVPYWLVLKRYWRALIGNGGAWFLFDFVVYPNSLFSGAIISSVIPDGNIQKTAEWQLLLTAMSLPGVFIGVWLCNLIGRRNTMILGFSGYVLFGLIIGIAYDKVMANVPLFVVFYGIMQSLGVLGPGNMVIVTSAESFATPVRGTCYGLSAALGKTGAALGTQVFIPIQTRFGKRWTFVVAALCGLLGVLVTFAFVPDMTGVDLAEEDAKFVAYLGENGWDGEVGENHEQKPVVASYVDEEASEKEMVTAGPSAILDIRSGCC